MTSNNIGIPVVRKSRLHVPVLSYKLSMHHHNMFHTSLSLIRGKICPICQSHATMRETAFPPLTLQLSLMRDMNTGLLPWMAERVSRLLTDAWADQRKKKYFPEVLFWPGVNKHGRACVCT